VVIKFDLSKSEMRAIIYGVGLLLRGYDDKFTDIRKDLDNWGIARLDLENIIRKLGLKGDMGADTMLS
jgi:hypothetical protein